MVYAAGDAWYISNGAGMLLEKTYKIRALNSQYAVFLQDIKYEAIPKGIRSYYSEPWKVECRILYEESKRIRTQWIFKDTEHHVFFIAALGEDGSGFLEWYDDNAYVVEEQRLAPDGSGFIIAYTYKDSFLLTAEARAIKPAIEIQESQQEEKIPETAVQNPAVEQESQDETEAQMIADIAAEFALSVQAEMTDGTNVADSSESTKQEGEEKIGQKLKESAAAVDFIKNPQGPVPIPDFYPDIAAREGGLLWTDSYRYARSRTLRAVERVYYDVSIEQKLQRLSFPRFVSGSTLDTEFVNPGASFSSNFLRDIKNADIGKLSYTLDNKQRVITETRRDAEGNLIGELTNTWKNDRIEKVVWKAPYDERVIEFEYDNGGERSGEKNYRNGILERTVKKEGNTEIEELYLDNTPVIRAVWENGKKVSEERIAPRLNPRL
ncbi:MAG: hypothetical protein LBV68_00815 [Spirochaetaceae bacterium]|nr:hypothetical protein [Spirochaetaceae bacterium]